MSRLALEQRPPAWNDGSLLPESPDAYNTGQFVDPFTYVVCEIWARHQDALANAGAVRWQFASTDVNRIGPSIAMVPVFLPEDVAHFGPDRYMVLMRAGTGFEPTSDLPTPDEQVLIYSDLEWEVFAAGADDDEFSTHAVGARREVFALEAGGRIIESTVPEVRYD